jgi:hypothetical protein
MKSRVNDPDRRRFLRVTTGASLALVMPHTGMAADAVSRPRIGFLGVAYSHAAEKIRILRASTDFTFVGVPIRPRAYEFYPKRNFSGFAMWSWWSRPFKPTRPTRAWRWKLAGTFTSKNRRRRTSRISMN